MTNSEKSEPIDMDQALLNPGSIFDSPEALLQYDGLSKEQKIEILRRWEYDASEVCVSVEEGMPGGERDLLRSILLAFDKLTGGINVGEVGPTKQHGIPRSTVKRN